MYNYSLAEQVAKDNGLVIDYAVLENFAQHAQTAEFSQHQFDVAMHHHLLHVRKVMNPSTYTILQRIFGWGKKNG